MPLLCVGQTNVGRYTGGSLLSQVEKSKKIFTGPCLRTEMVVVVINCNHLTCNLTRELKEKGLRSPNTKEISMYFDAVNVIPEPDDEWYEWQAGSKFLVVIKPTA